MLKEARKDLALFDFEHGGPDFRLRMQHPKKKQFKVLGKVVIFCSSVLFEVPLEV